MYNKVNRAAHITIWGPGWVIRDLAFFLDEGCNLSYNMSKRLSSKSADKLRSLAYLRRSEAFCLKDTKERGGCNGIILKLETRFIYA